MKIREILFHDVRSFRGERRISFVDPLTNQARSLVLIAGTSGSGKTTILQAIEALLRFAFTGVPSEGLLAEVLETGMIDLELEIAPDDFPTLPEDVRTDSLHIVVGRADLSPYPLEAAHSNIIFHLNSQSGWPLPLLPPAMLGPLRNVVGAMRHGQPEMHGGLVFFPHDRQLGAENGQAIIAWVPRDNEWVFRFTNQNQWQGSLESFWVWQDYLDVKEIAAGHSANRLKTFVETIEAALGKGREITIEEAHAVVPVAWPTNGKPAPKIRLDQLPSGEQQCLLLLGELARRRRRGCIVMIDEPEISLHPTLQRLLIHQLRRFAREWDAQIILATHSLEMLRSVHSSEVIVLDQLDAVEAGEGASA